MPRRRRPLPLHHAVVLGLAQGPTELLPISSSAHTALIPWLCGWRYAQLDAESRKSFEVALHAGGALALLIDMRAEVAEIPRGLEGRGALALLLSLAPPALAGYTCKGTIEQRLGGPRSIAAGLLAGALAMALADARAPDGPRALDDLGPADGLALGIAQALALVPGVSRNGATLTAARLRGFGRRDAHALSWRVALPLIAGAAALQTLQRRPREPPPVALATGAGAAFLSTLASGPLRRAESPLLPFSLYRCALALLVLGRVQSAHNRCG